MYQILHHVRVGIKSNHVIIHQNKQCAIFRFHDHIHKRHQIYRDVGKLMSYTACTTLFDATYDLIGERYWPPNGKKVNWFQINSSKKARKKIKGEETSKEYQTG